MALNIGDINFGLDADTRGLKDAADAIRRFRTEVNRATRASTKGADDTARALGRQESAMKRAFQQTLNLNAAIRRSGGNTNLIAQNTKAFKRLQRELTSGRLSAVEFMRAMDAFNARLNRSSRSLKTFNAEKASKSVSKFNEVVRDLESASVLAVGPLSGLGARIRAIGAITTRSTIGIAAFLGGITAVTVGVGALLRGAFRAGAALETIQAGFFAATGSATLAAKELAFVTSTSERLGVNLQESATQFSQLVAAARGTVLEGQGVRDIFEGVSTAAAALKLRGEQVTGMFRAITQIISKGTVQSEELRGQLGERLPGAFGLAARALGVTTGELNKMLEKGEVLAEDLLPKLSALLVQTFGRPAQKASSELQGTINKLQTAVFRFNAEFDKTVGVTSSVRDALASLTSIVESLRGNIGTLVAATGAVTGAMLGLAAPSIIRGLLLIGVALRGATAAMIGLNIATLSNPIGAIGAILGRVALAATGATAGFYAMKSAMDSTAQSSGALITDIDNFISISKDLGTASRQATNQMIAEAKKRIEVVKTELAIQSSIFQRQAQRNKTVGLGLGEQLRKFLGAIPGFGGSAGQEAAKATIGLRKELDKLQVRLEELQSLPTTSPISNSKTSGKADKDVAKAQKAADDLIRSLTNSRQALDSIAQGGEAVNRTLNFQKGIDVISKLNSKTLPLFAARLRDAGLEGSTIQEKLATLFGELDANNERVREFTAAWERTPEILMEAQQELTMLNQAIAAMNSGPAAFEQFERLKKQQDKVKKFREQLESTALSQAKINELTIQYQETLGAYDEANERLKQQQRLIKGVEDAFGKSFDRIAASITDAFVKGGAAAFDFRNVVDAVVADILQTIIQIELVEPLKKGLTSSLDGGAGGGGFLGQIFGGGLSSIFGGGAAAAGGAPVGFVPGLAGGGVALGGRPHIVGEEGPELFIPGRTGLVVPNGAMGGSNQVINVTNNFTVQGGGEVSRRSQQEIAASMATSLQRSMQRAR